jgi:hypothetical protein
VARAAAVARDVHGGGDVTGVLECLEHGDRIAREVLLVQVVDRVGERLGDAGRSHRCERRSVFDDAPLAPMPPDEVRDVVHVGTGPRRDRRQAHRRQRREDRRRAVIVAVLGKERERRRPSAGDGALESGGRQPVHDDQDELLSRHQSLASVRSPA